MHLVKVCTYINYKQLIFMNMSFYTIKIKTNKPFSLFKYFWLQLKQSRAAIFDQIVYYKINIKFVLNKNNFKCH